MEDSNSSLLSVEDDFQTAVKKGRWSVMVLIWMCIAGDVFIIYIIKKTPTLRSYTGTLFISQTLSDVCGQVVSLFILAPSLFKINTLGFTWQYVLGLIGRAFYGITCQTLAAICLNLYFAICHSAGYRQRISKRSIKIFVLVCWIFNIVMCMVVPLMLNELRTSLFTMKELQKLPVYDGPGLWAWITFVTTSYIIPTIITAFSFVRIRKYSGKIQPITSTNLHYRDKYKLSQIIAVIAVCYIGTSSLMHVFSALQVKNELHENGIFYGIFVTAYFISLLYNTFKLFIYMLIYKPIRNTAIQVFKRSQVTPVQAIVARDASQTV